MQDASFPPIPTQMEPNISIFLPFFTAPTGLRGWPAGARPITNAPNLVAAELDAAATPYAAEVKPCEDAPGRATLVLPNTTAYTVLRLVFRGATSSLAYAVRKGAALFSSSSSQQVITLIASLPTKAELAATVATAAEMPPDAPAPAPSAPTTAAANGIDRETAIVNITLASATAFNMAAREPFLGDDGTYMVACAPTVNNASRAVGDIWRSYFDPMSFAPEHLLFAALLRYAPLNELLACARLLAGELLPLAQVPDCWGEINAYAATPESRAIAITILQFLPAPYRWGVSDMLVEMVHAFGVRVVLYLMAYSLYPACR